MKLRPMTMADAGKMYKWKNYPETIDFAIKTKQKINYSDHIKWLEQNIQYFKIIGDMQGAIRIHDNEISIWIDRCFWRAGIATKVLKQISKQGMIARIVVRNIGSMRAFINAGFKPICYQDGYYIFKK